MVADGNGGDDGARYARGTASGCWGVGDVRVTGSSPITAAWPAFWGFKPRGRGLSAPDTAAYFLRRNGITTPPASDSSPQQSGSGRTSVSRSDYSQDGYFPVVLPFGKFSGRRSGSRCGSWNYRPVAFGGQRVGSDDRSWGRRGMIRL